MARRDIFNNPLQADFDLRLFNILNRTNFSNMNNMVGTACGECQILGSTFVQSGLVRRGAKLGNWLSLGPGSAPTTIGSRLFFDLTGDDQNELTLYVLLEQERRLPFCS